MSGGAGRVGILFRHELRMLLRDRRTILLSVVVPLAVMPLLLFSGRLLEEKRKQDLEETTYTYAVDGSEVALVRALLGEAEAAARQPVDEGGGDREIGAADEPAPKLNERRVSDPEAALEADDLDLVIHGLDPAAAREAAAADSRPDAGDRGEGPARGRRRERDPCSGREVGPRPAVPVIRIDYRGNRDRSQNGARKVRDLLVEARDRRRDAVLRQRGFPIEPESVAAVEEVDIASQAQVSGAAVSRFLTAMVMLFLFTGGAVIATDSIAGEKERGTLETLLTTAADRLEIVAAKLLSILAVALFISVTQVANLLVYVGLGVIPLPKGMVLEVSGLAAVVLFALFLPLAALISSTLLWVSGRARSYKEAQYYFTPLVLFGVVPGLAALLPGLDLRSAIALVPVANISVAVREVLSGRYDWPFLGIAWLVTAAAAAWAVRATIRSLAVERLITAPDTGIEEYLGGPALFPKRVLAWFAVIWVVLFVVAVNVEALSTMRAQVLFNVVGLFGVGSLIMIRKYRLAPREALALRLPRPAVWLAVGTGVPAGHLTGIGVFLLASRLFPVSERALESLAEGLLPEALPFWQLVLFIAVLPGIFEEIAFRGLLLHGLRRRFHPAALCLVVGLVFGLFHVTLFRILPTMFLGVLLTAVTLLTGSIFPAMAWHALNNGLALVAARHDMAFEALDPWLYLASAAVLGLSFWIVYRNRTPYRGLRPWRRGKRTLRLG